MNVTIKPKTLSPVALFLTAPTSMATNLIVMSRRRLHACVSPLPYTPMESFFILHECLTIENTVTWLSVINRTCQLL